MWRRATRTAATCIARHQAPTYTQQLSTKVCCGISPVSHHPNAVAHKHQVGPIIGRGANSTVYQLSPGLAAKVGPRPPKG